MMPVNQCSVSGCSIPVEAKGLCPGHYRRLWKTGEIKPDVPLRQIGRPLDERFWEKVDKNGPIPAHRPELGQCWEWTATISEKGYGLFRISGANRRYEPAHRFSWILINGEKPAELFVLHHCDNRRCVRPDHLFLGTAADNTADMMSKGREARIYGDQHWCSKLTSQQVAEMRRRYADKSRRVTIKALAEEYGTSYSNANYIVNYRSWVGGAK